MIYFEAPYFNIEGLTILKDHENPRQFYYYPAAPQLATNPDGSPSFLFVKFREDLSQLPEGAEPGGGFLSFDVDCRVNQDALDTARREIKKEFDLEDDPILAPLDYRDGTVRLIFLDFEEPTDDEDDQPLDPEEPPKQRFVVAAKYAARPAMYGDNRAAFSVQLSARGATLVQETLDAKTSLIGVVYDMSFVGMRPAYNINLKMDWDRVQTHFEEGFQADFLFFNADISKAVDKLIEDRVIEMDVVSFGAGESDADIIDRKDEAVQFVREFITEKFFEPSLNPEEARGSQWYDDLTRSAKSFRPGSFGYTKRDLTRIDKKKLEINMRERSAVERRIAPQGHLQGLLEVLKDFPREAYIKEVDLQDPYFQTVSVEVVGGAAMETDKIDAINVHLDYGEANQQSPQDIILRNSIDSKKIQWPLESSVGFNYQCQFEVLFKPDAPPGLGSRLQSHPKATNETKLIIDPRDLYDIQKVTVEPVSLPFERYSKVEVNLRYQDPENELELVKTIILQKEETPSKHEWVFRLADPTKTQYQYKLTFYPIGAEPIEGEWQDSFDPAVLVNDPYPNSLEVTVAPAGDFEAIRRIMVEMSYTDPDHNIHHMDLLTFDKDEMQTWKIRLVDSQKRDYQYRVIVQYKQGEIKRLPPVTSRDQLLFVGDVFERIVNVKVSAEGKPFERAGLSRVIVTLRYEDEANSLREEKELVLRGLEDAFDWKFKITDPLKDQYSYEVLYVQDDGFKRREAARHESRENLIIPIA